MRPARLERATFWFVAKRSIQLSYGRGELPYCHHRVKFVKRQGVSVLERAHCGAGIAGHLKIALSAMAPIEGDRALPIGDSGRFIGPQFLVTDRRASGQDDSLRRNLDLPDNRIGGTAGG